jgi:hypothetical protein
MCENDSHSWDTGRITTKPTSEKDGVKTFICRVCRAEKTEAVSLSGITKDPLDILGGNETSDGNGGVNNNETGNQTGTGSGDTNTSQNGGTATPTNPSENTSGSHPQTNTPDNDDNVLLIVIISAIIVVLLAGGAVVTLFVIKKNRKVSADTDKHIEDTDISDETLESPEENIHEAEANEPIEENGSEEQD